MYVIRDRPEWIGIKIPALLSQELFDKVQARLKGKREQYRQPDTHYLLSGRSPVANAAQNAYRRYLKRRTKTGHRISHKAAYACSRGVEALPRARATGALRQFPDLLLAVKNHT
jgi:hypothetical protein